MNFESMSVGVREAMTKILLDSRSKLLGINDRLVTLTVEDVLKDAICKAYSAGRSEVIDAIVADLARG